MAGKKEYATRFGMAFLAVLFLVTSVGFSLLVIWQVRKDHKDQAAKTAASTNNQTGGAKLEGTKLANFTPRIDPVAKLEITDTVAGTGPEVKLSDKITAHYTGALVKDGTIFQSSLDTGQPLADYPLSSLIKGWQDGIPGMKAGGTRRLVIPAADAYGAQAQNGIPANSDLVFDIQLISIGQ